MKIDDELIRLLEMADPARVDDAAPVLEPAEYREALSTRGITVTVINREPATRRHRPMLVLLSGIVAAAVVAIVLVVTRQTDVAPARAVVNPVTAIQSEIVNTGEVELFRVYADRPAYWRLSTLAEFDGLTFKVSTSPLTQIDEVDGSRTGGRTNRQQIRIVGLGGNLLPAAADPRQVSPNAEIMLTPDASTLIATGPLHSGDRYTIVSVAAEVSPEALRAATSENPPDEVFLGLPDDLAVLVSELADEVTAGATTNYDRMIALQNWFRTFVYSIKIQKGHGSAAIENFLQSRIGYCEQFTAAFVVMARTLGIPSRAAVGFTPGTLNADGSYTVLGKNAHSWPEVWFDGLGWVSFEPTPGRGNPDTESYTGVAPAQAVALDDTP